MFITYIYDIKYGVQKDGSHTLSEITNVSSKSKQLKPMT